MLTYPCFQRRISFSLLLIAAMFLAACGGGGAATTATLDSQPQQDTAVSELVRELESSPVPEGVDPEVYAQLTAALAEYLQDNYSDRVISAAPTGSAGRVTEILYSDGVLRWTYHNGGDYNNDSEVGINDLTSVGLYWMLTPLDADWAEARSADGNGDGEVNVSDITPIGQNYLADVAGYKVLAADSAAGPFTELADVPFGDGLEDTTPLEFEAAVDPAGVGSMLFVQPYDGLGALGEVSVGVPAGGGGGLGLLPGPVGDPMGDHLPELVPPVPPESDFTLDTARSGLFVSRTRIIVALQQDTTVGEANQLLTQIGGRVIGTLEGLNLLIVELDDPGDLSGVHSAVDSLETHPEVALVVEDVLLGNQRVGSPSGSSDSTSWGSALPNQTIPNPWQWDWPPSESMTAVNGNWGLEAVRAPMAWNLLDYARRQDSPARVIILDTGFNSAHPDGELDNLSFKQVDGGTVEDQLESAAHGCHVAGIVGAPGYTGIGTGGINPMYQWVAADDDIWVGWSARVSSFSGDTFDGRETAFDTIIFDIYYAWSEWDDTVVVNTSLGYNWAQSNVDTAASADAREVAKDNGWIMRFLSAAESDKLLCTAAGNDSAAFRGWPAEQDAAYASPMCWAALHPDPAWPNSFDLGPSPNIIVVESATCIVTDTAPAANAWEFTKSDFSNVGGHTSAPGSHILSVVGNNLQDRFGNNYQNYETFSGTSMSSPLVTGLISYLASIDPTLSPQELRTLVTLGDLTTPVALEGGATMPAGINDPAEMVDAFASVIAIDGIQGNRAIQRALVDVDDGTRDGNLRTAVSDDAGHDNPPDPDPDDIHTTDQRRGDGDTTMKDFRAWRDAWLEQNRSTFSLNVELDGPTDHFKRDYNFDGAVQTSGRNGVAASPAHPVDIPVPTVLNNVPAEDRFSRYDFNGDGEIEDWAATAPYRIEASSEGGRDESFTVIGTPGFVRDIDVLANSGDWFERDILREQNGDPIYYENVSIAPADEGQTTSNHWTPRRFLLANRDGDASVDESYRTTPDYLHSCDIHFNLDWSWLLLGGSNSVELTVTSQIDGAVDPFVRTGTFTVNDPWKFVLTVPVWTNTILVHYETNGGYEGDFELQAALGRDIPVRISRFSQLPDILRPHENVYRKLEPILWYRYLGPGEGYRFYSVFVTEGEGGTQNINFTTMYSQNGVWSEPVVAANVNQTTLIAGADLYGYPAIAFDDGEGNLLFKSTTNGTDWDNFDRTIDSGADFSYSQIAFLQHDNDQDFIIYSKDNGVEGDSVYFSRSDSFTDYAFGEPQEVGRGVAPSALSLDGPDGLFLVMFDPLAPDIDAAVKLHQWSTEQSQFGAPADLPLESIDGNPAEGLALELGEFNGAPAIALLAGESLYWVGSDGSYFTRSAGETGAIGELPAWVRPQVVSSAGVPAIMFRGEVWQSADSQAEEWQQPYVFSTLGSELDPDYLRLRTDGNGLLVAQFMEAGTDTLIIQGDLP